MHANLKTTATISPGVQRLQAMQKGLEAEAQTIQDKLALFNIEGPGLAKRAADGRELAALAAKTWVRDLEALVEDISIEQSSTVDVLLGLDDQAKTKLKSQVTDLVSSGLAMSPLTPEQNELVHEQGRVWAGVTDPLDAISAASASRVAEEKFKMIARDLGPDGPSVESLKALPVIGNMVIRDARVAILSLFKLISNTPTGSSAGGAKARGSSSTEGSQSEANEDEDLVRNHGDSQSRSKHTSKKAPARPGRPRRLAALSEDLLEGVEDDAVEGLGSLLESSPRLKDSVKRESASALATFSDAKRGREQGGLGDVSEAQLKKRKSKLSTKSESEVESSKRWKADKPTNKSAKAQKHSLATDDATCYPSADIDGSAAQRVLETPPRESGSYTKGQLVTIVDILLKRASPRGSQAKVSTRVFVARMFAAAGLLENPPVIPEDEGVWLKGLQFGGWAKLIDSRSRALAVIMALRGVARRFPRKFDELLPHVRPATVTFHSLYRIKDMQANDFASVVDEDLGRSFPRLYGLSCTVVKNHMMRWLASPNQAQARRFLRPLVRASLESRLSADDAPDLGLGQLEQLLNPFVSNFARASRYEADMDRLLNVRDEACWAVVCQLCKALAEHIEQLRPKEVVSAFPSALIADWDGLWTVEIPDGNPKAKRLRQPPTPRNAQDLSWEDFVFAPVNVGKCRPIFQLVLKTFQSCGVLPPVSPAQQPKAASSTILKRNDI